MVRPAKEGTIRISGPTHPQYQHGFRLYPVYIGGSCRRGGVSRRIDRFGNRERSQDGPTQSLYSTQAEHSHDYSTANAYPSRCLGDCRFSGHARNDPGYRNRSGASFTQRLWLWR